MESKLVAPMAVEAQQAVVDSATIIGQEIERTSLQSAKVACSLKLDKHSLCSSNEFIRKNCGKDCQLIKQECGNLLRHQSISKKGWFFLFVIQIITNLTSYANEY